LASGGQDMAEHLQRFGVTAAGAAVDRITLTSAHMTATLLTYGCALQSLRLAGVAHDLTLGSDTLADYESPMCYHGTLVGPVANRLTRAAAPIDGRMVQFPANEATGNLLHGGADGIQTRIWTVADLTDTSVTLTLELPHGDGGFPGNRHISACFTITGTTLRMDITATTDAPTLMNLAQHSYWNLNGTETWAGHTLRIAADAFLPVTADLLPLGHAQPVADTPLDFRRARRIAPGTPDTPGMDTCFCLGAAPLRDVLWLTGDTHAMTLATTERGVQVYDGQQGIRPGHAPYEGLAIEAQGWPDAPNHPTFPSIALAPGQTYRQTTTWRFEAL
jgi:aldose 1-epimerase